MAHWQFRDYVDPVGNNLIRHWLDSLPIKAQMRIDSLIRYLEVIENPQQWQQYVKPLKGQAKGLMELRLHINNIQYRPLACYGPRRKQVTLLYGAVEKGDRFEPKNACQFALDRKSLVESGYASTCPHEFN